MNSSTKTFIMQGGICRVLVYAMLVIGAVSACGRAFAGDEADPAGGTAVREDTKSSHTIVLLQGMGRGRASLWVLDTRLQQAGYTVFSFPYTAHKKSIDGLADELCGFIRERVKTERYHLIAHSLGNVIIRAAFQSGLPPGLDRIVMLAPPNQTADLARALRDSKIYQWFTGESGQQLASDEFYARLPLPTAEFGVIAGDRGQSLIIKEPNDGVISVENTRLTGMKDWVVVHESHNFIMNSRMVAALCISFIERGMFDPELLKGPQAAPPEGRAGTDAPNGKKE